MQTLAGRKSWQAANFSSSAMTLSIGLGSTRLWIHGTSWIPRSLASSAFSAPAIQRVRCPHCLPTTGAIHPCFCIPHAPPCPIITPLSSLKDIQPSASHGGNSHLPILSRLARSAIHLFAGLSFGFVFTDHPLRHPLFPPFPVQGLFLAKRPNNGYIHTTNTIQPA